MENILSKISAFAGNGPTSVQPSINRKITNNEHSAKPDNRNCFKVAFLCYSKDRPFQLSQLLKSIYQNVHPQPDYIFVLCSAGQWQSYYEAVQTRYPNIKLIYETDFHSDFISCMKSLYQKIGDEGIITFLVDDMIFISDVDLW
jgi:hypothetical protein